MVTTGAIIHGGCLEQLNFNKEIEHPVAVQLGGSDPNELAQCANCLLYTSPSPRD